MIRAALAGPGSRIVGRLLLTALLLGLPQLAEVAAQQGFSGSSEPSSETRGFPGRIGWRGDGSGRYPDAKPPLSWQRRARTILAHLHCQADAPAEADGRQAPPVLWTGSIPEWLILGPLPAGDPSQALEHNQLANETTVQPRLEQTGDRQAWRRFSGRFADLKPGRNQVYYLHTYLFAPEAGKVNLWLLGHSRGIKIQLNGKALFSFPQARDGNGRMKLELALARGWNRLLIKLLSGEGQVQVSTRLGPTDPYSYETRHFSWITPLPGHGNGMPLVVGNRIFLSAEPYYLLCISRQSGKVLWLRSNSYYDARREELARQAHPRREAFETAWKHLTQTNETLVRLLNAAVSASGPPSSPPVIPPRLWTEKQAGEKALHELIRTVDADYFQKLDSAWEQGQPGWSVGTPCSDGKHIYAWYAQGVAACYDLEGNPVWRQQVDFEGNRHHGYSASPVLAGGKFIVEGGRVLAFDARTGHLDWKAKSRFLSWGSLVTTRIGPADVVFTGDGSAFQVADGKPVFRPGFLDTHKTTTSIIDDQVLYDVRSGGMLEAHALPTTVSRSPRRLYQGELDFPRLPDMSLSSGVVASLLHHNGLLYVLSQGGYLKVFEAKTGTLVYAKRLALHPYVGYTDAPGCAASPALAGSRAIYTFDNAGTCVVFEAGRDFKQLAQNVIENQASANQWNESQEQIWSTPVFAGRQMILRSPELLYCIEDQRADRTP